MQNGSNYFSSDRSALARLSAEREYHLTEITLDSFRASLKNESKTIAALLGSSKRHRNGENAVRDLLADRIAASSEERLAVTYYSPKSGAKQTVYLYVGTHWELVRQQMYYDFVKSSSRQIGLSDLYAENPEFMNRIFESVAFRVSKDRDMYVPADHVLINFRNGTLMMDGEGNVTLYEHRKDDFFTYCLPYAYDENATCPMWEKFLDQVMPDRDMQLLLAEYLGYCFTKNMKLEKMAVFFGMGSNGKSVVLDVVHELMGRSNVSNVSLSALTTDDVKRAVIENKLVNISYESSAEVDTSILKQLISGEPTEARILYVGPRTLTKIPKLLTSFNRLPPSEATYGYFRRWILFPFSVTIPDDKQDHQLAQKLCAELSGIFNWVMRALKGLLGRKAFSQCEACEVALNTYKRESNSAMLFLYDRYEKDDMTLTTLSSIYSEYRDFCNDEGIMKRVTKKTFKEVMLNYGFTLTEHHHQVYVNVRVKTSDSAF